MDRQAELPSATLTAGELAAILWSGRWVLLAALTFGLILALIAFPPGRATTEAEVWVDVVPLPQEESVADVDWWPLLLEAARAPETGEAPAAAQYAMSVTRTESGVFVRLSSGGNSENVLRAVIARFRDATALASQRYIDIVNRRLEVLKTLEVPPGAEQLVVREAFNLELFLSSVAERPLGVYTISVSGPHQMPQGGVGAYVHYILIALAFGLVVVIGVHLLGVLLSGRKVPRRGD